MKAVFDSDVLIDFLQGHPLAKPALARYRRRLISAITYAEVLTGAGDELRAATRAFLQTQFRIIPVTVAVADQAAENRRRYRHKLPDALILATAQTEGCPLLTRNAKDFPADDPRVIVPYAA
jgi:predicted nucleic acid-binding protein